MAFQIDFDTVGLRTISDTEIALISHCIPSAQVEQHIKDAVLRTINKMIEECEKQFKADVEALYASNSVTSISTDIDTFVAAAVLYTGYKDADAKLGITQN